MEEKEEDSFPLATKSGKHSSGTVEYSTNYQGILNWLSRQRGRRLRCFSLLFFFFFLSPPRLFDHDTFMKEKEERK